MKKWRFPITLCLFFGALLILWNIPILSAQDTYHVVFVSNRDGNDEIYVANIDGTNLINLTQSVSRDWHPDWSPNGERIVFTSDRDGNQELYLMQNNGLEQTNLTRHPANDNSPAWSPDGSRIVFGSDRDGGQDLYLIEIASGNVTRLTTDGIVKSAPAWSPDGTQVTFWQMDNNVAKIYAITIATGIVRQITTDGPDNWPVWSPDGMHIAFENAAAGQPDIFVINLADGSISNLTNDSASDIRPAWSANGSQIVFASNRNGNYDLYVMNADGSLPRLLLALNGDENSPVWQPVPAPIQPTNSSGVVVQSYTQIGADALAGALSDQKVLGGGDMRLLAPDSLGVNEVLVVRLEVELQAEDTPADATPAPAPTAAADLRESTYLDEVYAIMGAELRGVDIDRFKIDPSPTDYVLRLRADAVNYWEWTLRPKGNESLGTSYLAVSLYAPELMEDGSIVKTVIQDVRFQVEVKPAPGAEVVAPTPTPEAEIVAAAAPAARSANTQSASFSVLYSNPDSFTVLILQPMVITGLTVSSALKEEWVFAFLPDQSATVSPGTCFYYYRYDTEPPIPSSCSRDAFYEITLDGTDIFWYDKFQRSLIQTIIKYGQQQLGTCPGDGTPCNFSIQGS